MRSIRVLSVAFVAMLALSGITAGSASALRFLTFNASEPFTVNEATETKLETLGSNTVTCGSTLASGTLLNNTDVADNVLFTFHKCSTSLAGECTTAGESKGLIMTHALKGLLVTLSNKKYGIVVDPASGLVDAEFSCEGIFAKVAVKVSGGVVGEFTGNPEVASTEHEIAFRKKGTEKGMQEWTAFETLTSKSATHLTTEITGSITETRESSEEGKGLVKTAHASKVCHS